VQAGDTRIRKIAADVEAGRFSVRHDSLGARLLSAAAGLSPQSSGLSTTAARCSGVWVCA
jgi:hypothetical protein